MITYLGILAAGVRRKKLTLIHRRNLRRLRDPWLRRLIGGL